jgi:hypothetical protein
MTDGHRHRVLKIRRYDARWVLFLRKKRWFSTDLVKVEKSRFAWVPYYYAHGTVYGLSLLGILHGLFGLTLYWEEVEDGKAVSGDYDPI